MKKEAMQKHPEEWFFLHNFDVDRVFSTIRRTDYLVLFYIKMRQESHPDEKLYLADLAAEMGVKVTELSKASRSCRTRAMCAGSPTGRPAAPMWS